MSSDEIKICINFTHRLFFLSISVSVIKKIMNYKQNKLKMSYDFLLTCISSKKVLTYIIFPFYPPPHHSLQRHKLDATYQNLLQNLPP